MAIYNINGDNIGIEAVSVENFGAIGDGISDDTSAFQRALNHKGFIICKTGKTYRITDTLRIGSDTTLDLNNSTIVAEMKHLMYNFTNEEDANTLGYNGKGNLTIRNGKIIGGAISFAHGENIELNNVHFSDSLNDHFLEIAGCKNYRIINCSFVGMGDWQTSVYEYINLDRCIYGNIPWMPSGSAFYDLTANADLLVKGCKFTLGTGTYAYGYNAFGAHSPLGGGTNHTGITVEDCDISAFTGCGLRLNGMSDVFINNNRIQTAGNGIVIGDVASCNTVVIKNNYVTSANGSNLVKTSVTNLTVVGNYTAGTIEDF